MEEPVVSDDGFVDDGDDASDSMAELLEETENNNNENNNGDSESLLRESSSNSNVRPRIPESMRQAEKYAKELPNEEDPLADDHAESDRPAEDAVNEILDGDHHADDRDEMNRLAEEAMEEMLLAQEEEHEALQQQHRRNQNAEDDFLIHDLLAEYNVEEDDDGSRNNDENNNMHDDMAFLDDDDLMNNNNNNNNNNHPGVAFQDGALDDKSHPFTYVRVSFWAAVILVYYAFRSRQQWYLALVFLSSSKYAYVILGNAFVASLVWGFHTITGFFLNGLRLNEAEGLGDYFRWHITETCLALTIFRSELTVKTAMLFLCLVFSKCLHHIVDAREAHFRMTEEIVVANTNNRYFSLRLPHVKLFGLITLLQIVDIGAVVLCGQDIAKNGPSVSILFCFESAIMLASVVSNALLWHLHLLDGVLHHLHETSEANHFMHRWIYPWKDHKATLVFAVELQAQFSKFLFYLIFFSIVFTYYGLPINLIREVYVSFLALKSRVLAFNKYRKLMSSMNRFENPNQEELEEEHICIICREEMTVETAKKLPGCGHIFHKSCLREWLVQQQTCPTCRGDISQMEARQKQQDAFNARIQGYIQREEEEEEENTDSDENDEDEEIDENDRQQDENGEDRPSDELEEKLSPILPEVEADKDSKPPPLVVAGQPSAVPVAVPIGTESFPAFYKVVNDTGASVYRHEDEATAFLVTRVVPCGVVLLGTSKEDRTCILQKKSMVRMPDGWVNEDDLSRIAAVSLQSSQQESQ